MNIRIAIVLAYCLTLSAAIVSAVEPPENPGVAVLCVFTAQALPAENSLLGVVPFTPYDLYLVLYHPTGPEGNIGGVEFQWRLDPPIDHMVDLSFNSETWINVGDEHNIVCGLWPGAPVEGDHAFIGTIELLFLASVPPTLLYLQPLEGPQSIPGEMAYDRWPDPSQLMVMVPYSEGFTHDSAVFGFNSQIVATEIATWSEVKALFD